MSADFFAAISDELRLLLDPVLAVVEDPVELRNFLRELGWPLVDQLSDAEVRSLLGPLDNVEDLLNNVSNLTAADAEGLEALMAMLESSAGLFSDLVTNPAPGGAAIDMDELRDDLIQWLVIRYLDIRQPVALATLRLLAIVESVDPELVQDDGGAVIRVRGVQPRLHLSRLGRVSRIIWGAR